MKFETLRQFADLSIKFVKRFVKRAQSGRFSQKRNSLSTGPKGARLRIEFTLYLNGIINCRL